MAYWVRYNAVWHVDVNVSKDRSASISRFSTTMKMEALNSFEMLVTTCQTADHRVPQNVAKNKITLFRDVTPRMVDRPIYHSF